MAGHWQIVVPEAGTNLVTNPSFETATTGWATDGANTIAQSSTVGKFGAYSLLCTYQNDTDLARYAITLTAAAHTFSIYVYLGSTWDGGAIRLAFENFAGGAVTTATTTTTTLGEWVRLQATYTPVAGDLAGDLVVQCASAPTAGRFIYIDAAMCQALTYVTTYIDGDQAGCEWTGTVHGSTSTRSASSRAGGRVYDLQDDYGFLISQATDVGMSPLTQHLDEYAIIPGGEVSGYKVHPRVFVLQGTFYSLSSWTDLHSQIQAFIGVIRPDAVPNNQPFLLRYTAATVTKEIACYYESGLDGALDASRGWQMNATIRLLAADPVFYGEGEHAQALDTADDLTIYSVAQRSKDTGTWNAMDLSADPDAGGSIRAILHASDGSIYIGGDFVDLNNTGTNIDRIAKYNPTTGVWSLVGSGSDIGNGMVRCLAEAANGDIYVGGTFTAVSGDGNMDYVCYYDVSAGAWAALGNPDNVPASITGVYGLAFDSSGNLYAVGAFSNFAGIANADCIAKWTGAAWASMGVPSDSTTLVSINDVTVDASDNIHIVGDFTSFAGDGNSYYWSVWNGAAWSAPSWSSAFNAALYAIDYNSVDNRLYFGGAFTNAINSNGDYIVNGVSYPTATMGSGTNGIVWDITHDGSGAVYAVGAFTTAGGVSCDRIGKWTGTIWQALDITTGATIQCVEVGAVDAIDSTNYDLYIGLGAKVTLTDGAAGSVTVTNNGSTASYPRFVFKRSGGTSATLKTIANATTGHTLSFDYALQDGETLTIDLSPSNKTITSNVSGDQYGAVTAGSDFGVFSLLPGSNTITCYLTVAGAPTIVANTLWRDSYWSVS